MRIHRLLAVAALFSMAPAASFALPPQCGEVCEIDVNCNDRCTSGWFSTTCRGAGYCPGASTPSEVSSDSIVTAENAAPVCEEQPSAEQSVTAGS